MDQLQPCIRQRVRADVCCALIAVLLPAAAQEEQQNETRSFSPDRKWEYRASGHKAVLVKAGSDEPVLKICDPDDSEDPCGSLEVASGKLVWAPDSRRFAFNCRKGGKYYGCMLFELAGTSWRKIPDLEGAPSKPVDALINKSLDKQRQRLHTKKDTPSNEVMTRWRVRRWLDNDSFEAYGNDERSLALDADGDRVEYFGCAVLFTGKCDNRGRWKVVSTRVLSEAEDNKLSEQDE